MNIEKGLQILIENDLKYHTILADPPWSFKTWSKKGKDKSPDKHYQCMSLEDIKKLPVDKVAADNSVLLLWILDSMIPEALEVIKSWGFKYIKVCFVWAKRSKKDTSWHISTGYYTRNGAELCLLAKKGHPTRLSKSIRQLLIAPVREHSRKPLKLVEEVEKLFPGKYLELFGREFRKNWIVLGNEINKFD